MPFGDSGIGSGTPYRIDDLLDNRLSHAGAEIVETNCVTEVLRGLANIGRKRQLTFRPAGSRMTDVNPGVFVRDFGRRVTRVSASGRRHFAKRHVSDVVRGKVGIRDWTDRTIHVSVINQSGKIGVRFGECPFIGMKVETPVEAGSRNRSPAPCRLLARGPRTRQEYWPRADDTPCR